MPGDELLDQPSFQATRAISIRAPPEDVWPWLVQIGYGRAGFYAYDLLDNLGHGRSAERIRPELQHLDGRRLDPDGAQRERDNGLSGAFDRAEPVDGVAAAEQLVVVACWSPKVTPAPG